MAQDTARCRALVNTVYWTFGSVRCLEALELLYNSEISKKGLISLLLLRARAGPPAVGGSCFLLCMKMALHNELREQKVAEIYCSSVLCPSFRKLDLFPFSGEGRKTPTLLGPLERANLNHLLSPEDGNIHFPKRRVLAFNPRRWTKSRTPVNLSIHQRQNLLGPKTVSARVHPQTLPHMRVYALWLLRPS
jgi:hypothetical protein